MSISVIIYLVSGSFLILIISKVSGYISVKTELFLSKREFEVAGIKNIHYYI